MTRHQETFLGKTGSLAPAATMPSVPIEGTGFWGSTDGPVLELRSETCCLRSLDDPFDFPFI